MARLESYMKTNQERKALEREVWSWLRSATMCVSRFWDAKSSPLEAMLRSDVTVVMHDVVVTSWVS